MKVWKRNAVVMTVVLFVCAALYLSWSYNQAPADPLENFVKNPNLSADVGAGAGTDAANNPLQNTDVNINTNTGDAADTNTSPSGEINVSDAQNSGYFAEVRLNRQRARDSAVGILQQTAASQESDQSIRDKATAEIEKLAQSAMSEARIEGLIRAKGFADCVAFINGDSISVVVASPQGGLVPTDVAKITDIVINETKLPASAIKISESKM